QRTWDESTLPLGSSTWDTPKIVVTALLADGGLVLVALLIELLAALTKLSGRRSAVGFNAVIEIVLAAAVLIAVHCYSFYPPTRFDWSHDPQTSEPQFTLPEKISLQLQNPQGETLIVVDQRGESFGRKQERGDAIDSAAKNHVVDKVNDLVEQFREFGTQFTVEVLDVKKEGFEEQFERITADRPALREALDSAPENSIFFFSPDGKHVQSLSFNDFYQLDKTASKTGNNLVMFEQGVEPFANRVLNVEAKRPVIGIAVTHEWLSTDGAEEYS